MADKLRGNWADAWAKSAIKLLLRAMPPDVGPAARRWAVSPRSSAENDAARRTFAREVDEFIRRLPRLETDTELYAWSRAQRPEVLALAIDRALCLRGILRDPPLPGHEAKDAADFFEHWLIEQWHAASGPIPPEGNADPSRP